MPRICSLLYQSMVWGIERTSIIKVSKRGGLPGGPVVGICLAVQEMCTQSLAWELRCHVPGATKP